MSSEAKMTAGYLFDVVAEHPDGASSGVPSYTGGQATAVRSFLVSCDNAQEFALRQIGKFYREGVYTVPQLPAEFPRTNMHAPNSFPWLSEQQFYLVASSFEIRPASGCCFNNEFSASRVDPKLKPVCITDPENIEQMERYYGIVLVNGSLERADNNECKCIVRINYTERPWDCDHESVTQLLPNTAIAVERNSAYEMYTLPNRNLYWDDINRQQLKGDTYAYIVVPRADVLVYWYNVPVKYLCAIEAHLANYRGTVNKSKFNLLANCVCASAEGDCGASGTGDDLCGYEEETMLFVDFSERREDRTRAFGVMNTTTLVLEFKHKRVPIDVDDETGKVLSVGGHNHLWSDKEVHSTNLGCWTRVDQKFGNSYKPLFPPQNWDKIMDPDV